MDAEGVEPQTKSNQENMPEVVGEYESVATSLKQWKHAYIESERIRRSSPFSPEDEYWDREAMVRYKILDNVFFDYTLAEKLIYDPNFKERDVLVDYLKYDLWLSWRHVVLSQDINNQPNPTFAEVFRYRKSKLTSIFYDAIYISASEGNLEQIRSVFEGFDNVGAETEADNAVFITGLSNEERLRVVVGYINTFGFIRAVDLVASAIKSQNIDNDLRDQLKSIYDKIEGEEAQEIAAELSEIYERIDFNKYHINENDLTLKETEILEGVILGSQAHIGSKNGQNVGILDIGAGTGRHVLSLRKRGYQSVVAFEFEQKHIDIMRKQDPGLNIVQGDWISLYDNMQAYSGKVDVAYCLGRSIAHNRTPSDMFHFFDEVQRTITPNGKFLFDMADINFGEYRDRINQFRRNLEAIGVQPMQSGIIFDGPNDINRFNRMILTPEQIKATAYLLGYRVVENRHDFIGDGDIKNIYYLLEKNDSWDASRISPQELNESLKSLGLLDPGTDYNLYIESWGMTLGQALVYVYQFGLGNEYLRHLNEQGRGPNVFVEFVGNHINLDTSGINKDDYIIAMVARGMNKAEVDKLLQDLRDKRISMYDLEVKASTM